MCLASYLYTSAANTPPEMMFLVESPQHTPTPSPTQTTSPTNSSTDITVGAIAGSVGGSGIVILIGLTVIIAVVVVLVRKRRKKKREAGPIHEESNTCRGLHMELKNPTLYDRITSDSATDSAIEQTTSEPTLQPDTSISPSTTPVHDGSQHNLTEILPPSTQNYTSDSENDTAHLIEPKSCSSSTQSDIHCIFPPQPATEDEPNTTEQCAMQCHTRPFTANHTLLAMLGIVSPESNQSPPHVPSTLVR